MFAGTGTALITPFTRDGQVDEESLRRLVNFQEDNGVNTLVPCGSTGESATLSHEEHIRVISIVRDEAKKAKSFAEADRIRDELKAQGIEIIDMKDGASWKRV